MTTARDATQLVRDYVAAGDANDEARLRALVRHDVVTHSPGGLATVGADHQVGSWAAAHRGLDRLHHEIVAVVAAGDNAAARVRVTGVHTGDFLGVAPTGRTLEVDQALFARVEGGLITELWEIVDTGTGLRQLGVLGDQPLTPGDD